MNVQHELIIACQESIEHWKKMRDWASKQIMSDPAISDDMKCSIGENWLGCSCSLCRTGSLLAEVSYDLVSCDRCPLDAINEPCDSNLSTWQHVDQAADWEEWIIEADKMIRVLEKAYVYVCTMQGVWWNE